MIARPRTGEIRGLDGSRDGGEDRTNGGELAGFGKGQEARGRGAEETGGESDGVDDDGFTHAEGIKARKM